MDFNAEYEPSTWQWVADQVEEYEASGGARANTLMETGIPIIVFTTCLLYTSPSPRDLSTSRMPSSA